MYRGNKIAVVVPAYNEEELIQETMSGIPDYVDRIYVINDGSTDRTEEIIRNFASTDSRFVLISHCPNKGVGAAIVAGYSRSLADKMDITAVMAGDNQMDPLKLHKLLDPIIDGEADYTKGNRLSSRDTAKGMSNWRYFGNNILTYLTRIAAGNIKINDPQNGYTAISNEVFKTINPESIFTWYGYCNDILVKLSTFNFIIKDIDIPARYGNEKSGISYPKYMIRLSRLLFNELIWRLNNQPNYDLSKNATRVMNLGSTISLSGAMIAVLSFMTPLGKGWMTDSHIRVLFVITVVGLILSYVGYLVKNGGEIDAREWRI